MLWLVSEGGPSSPPTDGSMGEFLSAICSGNLTAPGGKTHGSVGGPWDWVPLVHTQAPALVVTPLVFLPEHGCMEVCIPEALLREAAVPCVHSPVWLVLGPVLVCPVSLPFP